MEDKTNLGILIFRPINDAKEVISIGPKNHARGMLKKSAMDLDFFNYVSLHSFQRFNCLEIS